MPKVKTLRKHHVNVHPYKSDAHVESDEIRKTDEQKLNMDAGKPQDAKLVPASLSRGQRKRMEKQTRILKKQGKVELEGFKKFGDDPKSHKEAKSSSSKGVNKADAMLSELEASLMETATSEVIKPAAKTAALSNKSKHQIAIRESARSSCRFFDNIFRG